MTTSIQTQATLHQTIEVSGINLFYREAGNPDKPTLVLLHGYPTSSHMFRNLIDRFTNQYHILAPDYPYLGEVNNLQSKILTIALSIWQL